MSEPPTLPAQAPEFRSLLAPLIAHGVDFVLIGGQAGISHGSTYPSFDLDVAYARDRDNLVRMVAALEEIGVRLRGASAGLPFQLDVRTFENGANFSFETAHGDLDVLGDVAGVRSYEDLRAGSVVRELFGHRLRVASIDDLISMKRAANRTKDKLMVEEYVLIADRQRAAGEND